MAAKDLYHILQVPPTATMAEIKKAYRKLALQYHPDKNPDNGLSALRFLEIKKAYETLGNAAKRQQYNDDNWRQKRKENNIEPVTPASILHKINLLASHVSSVDVFRMSHEALYFQVKEILSDENLLVLQQWNDTTVNKKIVTTILKIIQPLPLEWIKKLEPALVKTAFTDNQTIQSIHDFITRKKKAAFWDKYNLLIILIITVLICLAIFFIGK